MNSYNVDVPVALIFFTRPDLLTRTFEQIRLARPSKLFLIQDGPRTGSQSDQLNVLACRRIVENIDWECEVYRNYAEVNLGCGYRVYTGLNWAFEHVNELIILEDDCVPSISFFSFCKEILNKYKDDFRVDMISGMNHLEIYDDCPSDYFFSSGGSIWGWATWKRAWINVSFTLEPLKDTYTKRMLENLYGRNFVEDGIDKIKALERGEKLSSWSYQRGLNMFLNSGLIVIPKVNLISNIGLTDNGTNTVSSLKFIPKAQRSMYFMKLYEMDAQIVHPKYIINDIYYKKQVDKILGNHSYFIKNLRRVESVLYRVINRIFG
jgi:hypothetical protein